MHSVPEPSTLVLLIVVVIGLAVYAWRRGFRPQFTLRTLLIIMTCCVVAAALWKCEADARRNFASKTAAVDAALRKILPDFEQGLYDAWAEKERAVNPTFAAWEQEIKSYKHKEKMLVYPNGSTESQANDYFGSSHAWEIVRSVDSFATDHSGRRIIPHDQVTRVDVKVTCSRPCSLLSRTTSLSITERPAPDNKRFLDLLKAELDRNGIRYEIKE